jgi:hypothetical protein
LTKGGGDDSLTRDDVDGGGAPTLGWGGGVVERTATRRGGAARCFRREPRGDGVASSGPRRWGADPWFWTPKCQDDLARGRNRRRGAALGDQGDPSGILDSQMGPK